MARYRGSVCRLCRREKMKLYLKGERCFSDKCSVERRQYPPGQHGRSHAKISEYGQQLREKQKAKRIYGLLERQFHTYFKSADAMKGITGENLLLLLERRLDNIVYRTGFASSRAEARMLVRQKHFLVNGNAVDIPSFLVRVGDEVQVSDKSRKIKRIREAMETVESRGLPRWLELEKNSFTGTIRAFPSREDLITPPINEQLIVELYSR